MNDRATNPELPGQPVEIRLERICKTFDSHEVLRGVDLAINRGEIVCIVGGSGSGKTVLLDHMNGLIEPTSGRVWAADHSAPGAPLVDLNALDEDALDRVRVHWAVVFQSNALYSGTVKENIAFWLREHTHLDEPNRSARIREALEAVGFTDIETLLRKNRDQLSGGMAKRVAVARAVAMDPALIFYDEPTTGLDPGLAAQVQSLVADVHARGRSNGDPRTSIVVTHDKDLLRRIRPRVVMLHEGRVYFDGPYERFAASDSDIIRPYLEEMAVLQRILR